MPDTRSVHSWPMLVVAAALMTPNGRILVQQRPAAKHHGGLWEFPGGKVEVGETPEVALARELAEELGIAVDPADCLPVTFSRGIAGDRPMILLLYRADRWQGTPEALEAPAIRWVTVDELAELPMPPADEPLVAALMALRRLSRTDRSF